MVHIYTSLRHLLKMRIIYIHNNYNIHVTCYSVISVNNDKHNDCATFVTIKRRVNNVTLCSQQLLKGNTERPAP